MIERYIYAVTKRLPEKFRNRTADELRALIEQKMVQMDRGLSGEEKINQVLLDLGSPREMAKRYNGKERYLIGPRYFDSYLFVLKIILFAVFIGVTVTTGLSILFSAESIGEAISGYMVSLIAAVLQAAAWVTGVFAFLEYREIAIDIVKEENWEPKKLPPLPQEKARIHRSETAFSIIFTALFLTLFVFKPEFVGIYYKIGDESNFIGLFELDPYTPFKMIVFLIFALSIFADLFKISKGAWTIQVAIVTMMLNALSAAFSIFIIVKKQIWNPEMIAAFESYGLISFDRLITLIILSIIAITVIGSMVGLYKALKYKPH